MSRICPVIVVLLLSVILSPSLSGQVEIDEIRANQLIRSYFNDYRQHFALVGDEFMFSRDYTGSPNSTGLDPARNRESSTTFTYDQSADQRINWPLRVTLPKDEIFARCSAMQKIEAGQYGYFYDAEVKEVIDEDSMIITQIVPVNPAAPHSFVTQYRNRDTPATQKYRQIQRNPLYSSLSGIYDQRFRHGNTALSLREIEGHIAWEQHKRQLELLREYFPDKRLSIPYQRDILYYYYYDSLRTKELIDELKLTTEIRIDGVPTRGLKAGSPWRLVQRTQLVMITDRQAIPGDLFRRGLNMDQFDKLLAARGLSRLDFVKAHIEAHNTLDRAEAKEKVLDMLAGQ